jgi:hypothetical protein
VKRAGRPGPAKASPFCGLAEETQRVKRSWADIRPPHAEEDELMMRVRRAQREQAPQQEIEEEEMMMRVRRAQREQAPHDDSATIVCDGSGGYRADLRGWAGAPCGIEGCVRGHEESHARDWLGRWPNGCKNPDGSNKPDGSMIPLGGDGYAAFLKASECTAYTFEEGCIQPLLDAASGDCRTTLQAHQTDTQAQKGSYCG